ncbi:hypothetical protein [Methanolobus sp. ZRKC5]
MIAIRYDTNCGIADIDRYIRIAFQVFPVQHGCYSVVIVDCQS